MVYEMESRTYQRNTEGFAKVRSVCAETVLKAIDKTAKRPLPPPEGIGQPLGNHASSRLSGFYKIEFKNLGYRVVYDLVCQNNVMKIIIISVRDDEAVYKEAERRIQTLKDPMNSF